MHAPAPAPAPAPPSGYIVDLPGEFDDQVKANRATLAEVHSKFDDGDLDVAERDARLDQLQTNATHCAMSRPGQAHAA